MAGLPHYERPPGIHEPWLGIWRHALAEARKSGAWNPTMRPMLDAYVDQLRLYREHMAVALAEPYQTNRESGLTHRHDGFAAAEKALRMARDLARDLGLPKVAQLAIAEKAEEAPPPEDPFSNLDWLAGAGETAPVR